MGHTGRVAAVVVGLAVCAAEARPAAPPAEVRGVERLPPGALVRFGGVRFRHGGVVNCLAYSPDGKTLASASSDRTVRLWDAVTGKELHRFEGRRGEVYAVAFSPDGKVIAYSADHWLCVRDARTGKELRRFPYVGGVRTLAFAPAGKTVALGGYGPTHLRDVTTGKQVRSFRAAGGADSLAFSPNGKVLAGGVRYRARREVVLWDAATGEELASSPRWRGVARPPFVFSRRGDTLFCGDGGGEAVEIDVRTGKRLRRLGGAGGGWFFCASPDGKLLASQDSYVGVRFWDLGTGKQVRDLGRQTHQVQCADFSPDGKRVATGYRDGVIRVWDVATGKPVGESSGQSVVWSVAFAPDGKVVATGSLDSSVRLWDAHTGKLLGTLDGGGGGLSLAWSARGGTLASLSRLGTGAVWDVAKKARQCTLALDSTLQPECLAIRADGRSVATGGRDGQVRLWDARTGKEVRSFAAGSRWVTAVGFAPDGKALVTGGDKGSVALWDLPGKLRWQVPAHEHSQVYGVAFAPDGRTVASGGSHDRWVRLWSAQTGKAVGQLPTPLNVTGVAFSPDGKTLACAGLDGVVRTFDLLMHKRVAIFRGHTGYVREVAIAPDGRGILSGGADGTALLWDRTGLRLGRGGKGLKLKGAELEALWKELGEADGPRGHAALWKLVASGGPGVALLGAKVKPRPAVGKRLGRLVADLGAEEFAVRERASEELARLAGEYPAAVRAAVAKAAPGEARRRARTILAKAGGEVPAGDALRARRAVQVLEQVDTPAARKLLGKLASGDAGVVLTAEARSALGRLKAGK